MFKKEVKYTGFDDEEVTETLYFNLTVAEIFEIGNIGEDAQDYLRRISASQDKAEIMSAFKTILGKAYGRRLPDNTFDKRDEWTRSFFASEAYSQILFEFFTDGGKAAEFMAAIMPQQVRDQVKAALSSGKLELPETPAPPKPKTLDDYSMTELTNMPYDEFDRLLRAAPKGSLTKEHLQLAFQRRP